MNAPAFGEQLGNFSAGFYRIQRRPRLHAETLATLCAAGRQHGAAALGSHSGTETMALRTLASVRLVSTFHFRILFYDGTVAQ